MRSAYMGAVLLAMLAGVAPALSDEGDDPAEQALKAVTQFCEPVMNGGDTAALAKSLGIILRKDWPANVTAWIKSSRPGDYYSAPLKKGTLAIDAPAVPRERLFPCQVALFDISPEEGERAYRTVEAYLQSHGYTPDPKLAGKGKLTAKFQKANETFIFVLGPEEKDQALYNKQFHALVMHIPPQ